jgi:hypothetical protein
MTYRAFLHDKQVVFAPQEPPKGTLKHGTGCSANQQKTEQNVTFLQFVSFVQIINHNFAIGQSG